MRQVIWAPGLGVAGHGGWTSGRQSGVGLLVGESVNQVPIGIYTILKLPPSGLDEEQARPVTAGPGGPCSVYGNRQGQITGACEGLLKPVTDPSGERPRCANCR